MAITLNQIAEICGVSRGTVDRALHNKGNVRPAVAERIKAVANEYGYTPVLRVPQGDAPGPAVWPRSAWRSSSGCRPRLIRSSRSR